MGGNRIDIKTGLLFPTPFLVLGMAILIAGVFVLPGYPVTAAILLVIAAFVLTSYEGTEINPVDRTIREYYAFFFVKTGKAITYDTIHGISIHSAKISQRMFTAHTTRSSTFSHITYNAYLKYDDDQKIFLFRARDKGKVLDRAGTIAARLKTQVQDHAVAR